MLLEAISELEEEYNNLGKEKYTLNTFLEQMSNFIEDKDNLDNEDKVKLMTIHQAKGLEFKYVFVVGLEEGYYPLSERENEIEEERRILYVAIIRAKEKCYISYSKERILGTKKIKRERSRFIKEINNEELVEIYEPHLSDQNIEEKNVRINNNISKKNEIELINEKEKKIDVGINNINCKNNNEIRINSNKEPNDNKNNNNLNYGLNKDIQNEEEVTSNLMKKEISDFHEKEKNNRENLGRFKFINKKRYLEK